MTRVDSRKGQGEKVMCLFQSWLLAWRHSYILTIEMHHQLPKSLLMRLCSFCVHGFALADLLSPIFCFLNDLWPLFEKRVSAATNDPLSPARDLPPPGMKEDRRIGNAVKQGLLLSIDTQSRSPDWYYITSCPGQNYLLLHKPSKVLLMIIIIIILVIAKIT